MLSDERGLVDSPPARSRRVEERLRAQARALFPGWRSRRGGTLVGAAAGAPRAPEEPRSATGSRGSDRRRERLRSTRLPAAIYEDPSLLERSASLFAGPEFTGWFLDPASVASESLEWLQARESRLVVSDQIKAERLAALVDRIIETQFDAAARRLWQGRLEEQAYVLLALGRAGEAAIAVAVARALANPESRLSRIPFFRALVERSLEIAGEVATGRLSAEAASRTPRAPTGQARGG
jgi:hypothetical protein